jgi:hypothetical protein
LHACCHTGMTLIIYVLDWKRNKLLLLNGRPFLVTECWTGMKLAQTEKPVSIKYTFRLSDPCARNFIFISIAPTWVYLEDLLHEILSLIRIFRSAFEKIANLRCVAHLKGFIPGAITVWRIWLLLGNGLVTHVPAASDKQNNRGIVGGGPYSVLSEFIKGGHVRRLSVQKLSWAECSAVQC